jgi:hypothetical protein
VAIVQISRITQRKGLAEDLPTPLASAELGWATDSRQLFIGNGTLAEGAPVVGNTEILTEFSDVLALSSAYTYKGESAGYVVQTGPTSTDPVSQSLQRRLDSYAVITDFGATGDGETDVTSNINRALNQIYCRSANPSSFRGIYFPAGIYVITDTIDIPAYATLYGDGSENTVIYFRVQNWIRDVAYAQGVLVYDTNTTAYYRSNFNVPPGTNIGDDNPDNQPYWTAEALPQYIARTADSAQETGVNIAQSAGAVVPQNISVSGIKFQTNQVMDGVLIEKASGCYFSKVTIQGVLDSADIDSAADDVAAVRWSSIESLVCTDVVWDQCTFKNFSFATATDQNIQSVTFSNNSFEQLYQGLVLSRRVSPANTGATGVRIVYNTFDQIYAQGIVMESVSLNASAHNMFYNVGNRLQQDYNNAAFAIIVINALNNISVGDMFVRNTAQSTIFPRIDLVSSAAVALGMSINGITFYQDTVQDNAISSQLQLGRYQRTVGVRDTLIDDSSQNPLFVVDGNKIIGFKMDYSIARNGFYRSGTLAVINGQEDTEGDGFAYTDDYVENGNTGVVIAAAHNLSTISPAITVSYLAAGANDGTIRYSINYLS